MNPQLNPWPAVLLLVVLACGLTACESEETVAPTLESTNVSAASPEPVATAGSTSAAPTQAESAITNETGAADEAGVIVRVADEASLAAWDVHDWPALFLHQETAPPMVFISIYDVFNNF